LLNLKNKKISFFNVLNILVIGFIKIYKFLSFMKPYRACRFIPTCSEYALQAYTTYNFFYASFLTLKRLLSCQPFSNKNTLDLLPILSKKINNIK
jgi:hypothetical protein